MKLIVLRSNLQVAEYSFSETGNDSALLVGRDDHCAIVLEDPRVSREHAKISFKNNSMFIENISDWGEVLLNGVLVKREEFFIGDLIAIGPFQMRMNSSQVITPLKAEPKEEIIQNDFEEEKESLSEEEQTLQDDFEDTFGASAIGEDFKEEKKNEDDGFDFSQNFEISTDVAGDRTGVFTNFLSFYLKIFGDDIPYDKYTINDNEIIIGRDPIKANIVLKDNDVSSLHAKITKKGAHCYLEDLGSSNGTLLNGERINKQQLKSGDEFLVGSTSFTFEIESQLLKNEHDKLMPVESNQEITREEIIEESVSDFNDGTQADIQTGNKSLVKKFLDLSLPRKIIYTTVIVGGLMLLLDEEDSSKAVDTKAKNVVATDNKTKDLKSNERIYSDAEKEFMSAHYEIGLAKYREKDYENALTEFEKVMAVNPKYEEVATYREYCKQALVKIEELNKKEKEELERKLRLEKAEKILEKAREAVKNREVKLAQALFAQILELDPENIEVEQLKLELNAYIEEHEKTEKERIAKEDKRKKMIEELAPGKNYYLNKEWFNAILKLEKFLALKDIDEDLRKEASDMTSESKTNIATQIAPMLEQARSFKQGQDLKRAYETYGEIRKIDPNNEESLNEMNEIRENLDSSAKKLYQEGLIQESMSYFSEAQERFQQVQQIAPMDSEYYQKATLKLKEYK